MKLYRKRTIERAKEELFSILVAHPMGMQTSQLSGTPQFHGRRTLRNSQIVRLLRSMSDRVEETRVVQGNRRMLWWTVKASQEEPQPDSGVSPELSHECCANGATAANQDNYPSGNIGRSYEEAAKSSGEAP